MTNNPQPLSRLDRFLGVAYSVSIIFLGLVSILFLIPLLLAVSPFIATKQQKQLSHTISRCASLIWAGCAGLLGPSFLAAGDEYELGSTREETSEKPAVKSPVILDALPCKTCRYFSWEIAAKFHLEHPCAVYPSDPSPHCPDYRSAFDWDEDDKPTKY